MKKQQVTQLNENVTKRLEERFYIENNDYNITVSFLMAHYEEATKELTPKERLQRIKLDIEVLERTL